MEDAKGLALRHDRGAQITLLYAGSVKPQKNVVRLIEAFAALKGELPQFEGPEGRSAEMTAQYGAWATRLAPLALGVRALRLSPRGGWQIQATGAQGPLTIELGRDDPDARLTRFVAVQPRTLGALAREGTRVDYVDLRYRNGFAARVPQFHEKAGKPAA